MIKVCKFNRNVDVWVKRNDTWLYDGLTRHGVAVEVVPDGLLQLMVR